MVEKDLDEMVVSLTAEIVVCFQLAAGTGVKETMAIVEKKLVGLLAVAMVELIEALAIAEKLVGVEEGVVETREAVRVIISQVAVLAGTKEAVAIAEKLLGVAAEAVAIAEKLLGVAVEETHGKVERVVGLQVAVLAGMKEAVAIAETLVGVAVE